MEKNHIEHHGRKNSKENPLQAFHLLAIRRLTSVMLGRDGSDTIKVPGQSILKQENCLRRPAPVVSQGSRGGSPHRTTLFLGRQALELSANLQARRELEAGRGSPLGAEPRLSRAVVTSLCL